MDKARIADLLRPFLTWPLSDGQLGDISTYIDILLKWNQRINLTAVREPEEIVTRHFGESLFAAQHLFPASAPVGTRRAPARPADGGAGALTCPAEQSSAPSFDSAQDRPGATCNEIKSLSPAVVDVGSGTGFPGMPMKIWVPDIQLTLIESNYKKATFLKEVIRALALEVEVFTGRAEDFPSSSADLITLRAVERFEKILPIAAGLVRPGGCLVLLIGSSQILQAKAIANGLDWQEPIPVALSDSRILLVGKRRVRT